jgi:catechol 2,3-dioxygenase-like lactoylglutathione lyase family enzyme
LERLKNAGVTITREPTLLPGTRIRHAFLEGPDHIVIELVEQRQP